MAKRILWIIGAWIAAVILINPGQPDEFYTAAAQRFGPYCSIIAGIPIFFGLAYLLHRKLNWRPAAFIFWAIYAFADLSVLTIAGWTGLLGVQASVSMLTKLLAAIFGARIASRTGTAA